MRVLLAALVLAWASAALRADAQPTAVPTPSGAGAVAPSDQSAVQPALPDERANRNVSLGTASPAPPFPPGSTAFAPVPTPASAASSSAPSEPEAPGHSEPNTGSSAAGTSGGHRKATVGPAVRVGKEAPFTVVAYEPGKSLTVRRPEGTAVTFGLAKKAEIPHGLAPGRSVTIRTRTEHGKKVVTRVRDAGDTPVLTNAN
jgi:hypothetical protein